MEAVERHVNEWEEVSRHYAATRVNCDQHMPDDGLSAKEVIQFVSRSDAIAPIWIKDIKKLTECKYGMRKQAFCYTRELKWHANYRGSFGYMANWDRPFSPFSYCWYCHSH